MPNEQKTIVISDIHMSNGKDYSWFQPPNADKLASMLNAVAAKQDPFAHVDELVLLGDVFDLWLYPVDETPWTAKQILEANPSVKTALEKCVENIPHVYYLNGNHDMDVTEDDLGLLKPIKGKVQKIDTKEYRNLHPTRHIEHGHAADLFNAPDDSGDTLGGYPLGYFITRLVATAKTQNEVYRALRDLYGKFHEMFSTIHWAVAAPKPSGPPEAFAVEEFSVPSIGSVLVEAIIGLLKNLALVEDDTVIEVSDNILKKRFGGKPPTVGDVTEKYRKLFRRWHAQHGLKYLLQAMLATESLDWYAKEVLAADPQLNVVVMGHTHASVSDSPYDNDGCWCDSSVFGHDDAAPTYVEVFGDTATPKVWEQSSAE